MKVEPLLKREFGKIGLNVDDVKYEASTGFSGRSDAFYGYLVIEYKKPGRLSTKAGKDEAIAELKKYLTGYATKQHHDQHEEYLGKAVGVAIDGINILFVRYSKARVSLQLPVVIAEEQGELFERGKSLGFHIQCPYTIHEASLRNLLIFVSAATRKPLNAAYLGEAFNPSSSITQQAISELYSYAVRIQRKSASKRVQTFYEEWNKIFGIVYGQELGRAEQSVGEIAGSYNMSSPVFRTGTPKSINSTIPLKLPD